MLKPLRVLIVEDSESDAQLMVRLFRKAGYQVASRRVETRDTMAAALAQDTWDSIIADHNLPEFDAFGALETLRSSGLDIPFIVVSASIGEETAVELMRTGAADYVMKDKLARLTAVMDRELCDAAIRRERRQATEALRASEERRRTILQTAMDGFWVVDLQGRLLEVNEAYCRMSGYSEQELLAMRISGLEADETADEVAAHIRQIVGEGPVRFETRHRRKDGSIFAIESSAQYQPVEGGRLVVFLRDITGRKRAEDALSESQHLLRKAQELSHIGHFKLNPKTSVVEGSDELFRIFGISRAEFQFSDFVASVHPDRRDYVVSTIQSAIDNKTGYEIEHYLLLRDGSQRYIKAIGEPVLDDAGFVELMIGTVQDITARKRAEDALRESEERYRTTVMSVGDGVITTGTEGRVDLLNPVAEALTGWRQEQARGKLLEEVFRIINEETRQPVENPVRRVMREGLVVGLANHTVLIARDGAEHPLADSGAPIRDEKGEITGVVLVFRDQTEERAAQKALRVALTKYEALFASFPLGITVSDRAGKILESNPMAEKLLGLPREEHPRRAIDGEEWRIVRPDGTPMPAEEYASVRALKDNRLVNDVEMGIVKAHGEITWLNVTAAPLPLEGYGVVITYSDITARKQAEEALRESEDRYRRITEAITDYIYTVRVADGRATETTHGPGCLAITGYREKEFAKDPFLWFRMVAAEDRPKVEEQARRILAGEGPPPLEHRIVQKKGAVRWVISTLVPHRDEHGALVSYDGLIHDVTERKQAEEALRQSEGLLRGLFENMPSGAAIYAVRGDGSKGSDYIIKDFNESSLRIEGKTRDEVVGRSLFDLRPTIDEYGLIPVLQRVWQTGKPAAFPSTLYVDEHYANWYENRVIRLPSGEVVAIYDDITERKRAEEALRASEEKYRQLFDLESDALFLIERESGRILEANASATALYGYSHDEWLTMRNVDISAEPEITTAASHAGLTDIPLRWHRKKDGAVFPVDIRATLFEWQGRPVHLAAIRDITERKRAQEALRAERDRAEAYLRIAGVMLIALDIQGKVTLINRRGCEVLGYSEDEILGRDWFDICLPPADRQAVRAAFGQLIAGNERSLAEFVNQVVTKPGELRLISWRNSLLRGADGRTLGTLSSGEDITERKQAEEQLRQSEADLRQAQQVAHVGSWRWDIKTNHLTWSGEMYNIFGIAKEGFSGSLPEVIARAIHPDDRAKVEASNLSAAEQGKPIALEYRVVWPDGTVRVVWAEAGELTRDEAGNPAALTGIVLDVTERTRIQEALRESDALLQRTWAGLDEAVFVLNAKTRRILMCSPAVEQVFGYRPEELVGETMRVLYVSQESLQEFPAKRLAATGPDGVAHLEYQMRRKDGAVFWSEYTVVTLEREPGSPPLVVSVVRDITERKRAEEALRESESRFRTMFQEAPLGIALIDSNTGQIYDVNPRFAEITGRTQAEMKAVDWMSISHPGDVQKDLDQMARLNAGEILGFQMDKRYLRPDGSVVWVGMAIAPLAEPALSHKRHLCMIEDITGRKQAEETIRASLREKELLLREIHHRVKNNLQIIASLLTLQAETVRDPAALAVFKDSQNRIRAMSLIHAKLYQSTDLAKVDFGGFVRDLGTILVRAYAVNPPAIRLQVKAGQADLAIDDLVPCSLIVNELLSNAIKYAFPPGAGGTITVEFSRQDGACTLRVADNGVGFPGAVDFRDTESLGLRLVILLVEQLEGTIELRGEGGTEFTIRFQGDASA